GDGHIAYDVQTVPAAGGPAGDDGDDDLRHSADESLDLEDVQASGTSWVDALTGLPGGVLVARSAADALVAAGAERPTAVLGARAVAGQQHRADIRGLAGMVEGAKELVDGVGPEGVAYLGAVEGDAHAAEITAVGGVDRPVVGDIGEVESGDLTPRGGIEDI